MVEKFLVRQAEYPPFPDSFFLFEWLGEIVMELYFYIYWENH